MELFDPHELKRLLTSGDVVTRDLATTAALGVLLDDLIQRREAEALAASDAVLIAESRIDVYRSGGAERVTMTHLPTDTRVEGRSYAETLASLRKLLAPVRTAVQMATRDEQKAAHDRVNVSSAADLVRTVYLPLVGLPGPDEILRSRLVGECETYTTTGHVSLTHTPTNTMAAAATVEAAADLLLARIPAWYLDKMARADAVRPDIEAGAVDRPDAWPVY